MVQKTIVCHPDNLQFLARRSSPQAMEWRRWYGLPLYVDPAVPRTAPQATGRIIAPDGTITERPGWQYQWDRFTTLTEGDLPWLLEFGLVREEYKDVRVVYILHEDVQLITKN